MYKNWELKEEGLGQMDFIWKGGKFNHLSCKDIYLYIYFPYLSGWSTKKKFFYVCIPSY